MKMVSNKLLGLSMGAGALVAAIGLGVQPGHVAANIQAAPVAPAQFSPQPPSPPPPPPPPAYDPNEDYWTGQGSAGGAPGGAGGG